jgi:hypothetical protein
VDSTPTPRTIEGGQRHRHRRTPLTALVVGLVFAGGVTLYSSTAEALPPTCQDGSPPPCVDPPDDPPDTTVPPGPGTPTWFARVSVLDQSRTSATDPGFNRYLTGGWSRDGSPRYGTPSGTVVWSNPPGNTVGNIGLTSVYLPNNGGATGFWLRELGAEFLCRSATSAAVPPSGRSIHVLAAPEVVTSAAELQELAGGFIGPVTPTPAGANAVRIDSIDLTPQANGWLSLVITGFIDAEVPNWPDDIDDDFTYVAKVRPYASNAVDPAHIVDMATDPSYVFTLDNWGDDAEDEVGGKVRAAVESVFATAINEQVAARPQIQWFAGLGYTTSFRRVTVAIDGLHVWPSLCRIQ